MENGSKRARFLFVTPPGLGHAFPVVPIAWAAKCAGHDVLVATCGMSLSAVQRAGLRAAIAGPSDEQLLRIYEQFKGSFITSPSSSTTGNEDRREAPNAFFQLIGELMTDDVIDIAASWKPDVIIHTPQAAAAPIAAAKFQKPCVFLGTGIEQTPQSQFEGLYSHLGSALKQHGIEVERYPSLWIDVAPPSICKRVSSRFPMRYIPYNGPAVETLRIRKRTGHRVAVTMGTVIPHIPNVNPFREIVQVARQCDAEFIIAGWFDASIKTSDLPNNVITAGWIHLDTLLASSDAVIHHGGAGTTLTACDAGLPQMIIPIGADQVHNGERLREREIAVVVEFGESVKKDDLNRLLNDRSMRLSAAQVREEMREMPSPAQLVERIADIGNI